MYTLCMCMRVVRVRVPMCVYMCVFVFVLCVRVCLCACMCVSMYVPSRACQGYTQHLNYISGKRK
jgi:hypothetical protein